MDKQNPKVTVKINGREKNIKDTDTPKEKEEEVVWVLPEKVEVSERKVVSIEEVRNEKKKQPKKLKEQVGKISVKKSSFSAARKFIVIVGLAVTVGVGFGMFGLNTITNDKQPSPVSQSPSAVAVNSAVTDHSEQTKATEKELKEDAKPGATATVDAFSIYIVQAGVFSSKEAAAKAKESLSGESVVFGQSNAYTIVVGASTSEAKAKELSDAYKKSGEDAYVKLYEMKGAAQLAESDEKVMSTLQPFMANVMDQVGKVVEGNKASSVSEVKKELDKIQEQTDNKEIGKLIKTLEQSVSSLESFNQSSKKSDGDQATKYMLTSLVQYQQIIKK